MIRETRVTSPDRLGCTRLDDAATLDDRVRWKFGEDVGHDAPAHRAIGEDFEHPRSRSP